ncbi:cytochrome c oxidase subunit 2 [Virgibacillus subterraneus]|uniref:Cytochrome c oxidase subunit 2 n=1 Tax=Virgibacillus subterraneus TaxID=621109 RepID=A0A1H9K9L8_9BACI|nr:cupredoxin domain-containing protein [Virgibacillus subterraneus]SEQ95896.1 cytochrome c oxidase subunit 2 [Virgibacillus subterraneus]
MKKGLLAVLALGLILFLAACGGSDSGDPGNEDDSSSASAASNELNITASNFDFDQDEYTVTAGEEVAVSLTNEEGMHGISIDEFDVKIEGEGEATFTPEEPGEYTIYCNIPCGEGHADMQTTLVVE